MYIRKIIKSYILYLSLFFSYLCIFSPKPFLEPFLFCIFVLQENKDEEYCKT